jgi:hypothetical protein
MMNTVTIGLLVVSVILATFLAAKTFLVFNQLKH